LENEKDVVYVDSGELRQFCTRLLKKANIDDESSGCIANLLVQSNLRGHDSHGVVRLPTYLERFGKIKWETPRLVVDNKATALIEGNNCMGQVCAVNAMNLAIEKARKFGIGVVGVRNSNHFGPAASYSMMASEENMIGFAFSNASPRLAPWGGLEPLLGNNPWSFAFPCNKGFPVVLDISNSIVAAGKIREAATKGELIPEGWAMDKEGNVTRNPCDALKGLLLPIGGHKGYGITMVVDILSGILTGSGFATQIKGIDDTNDAQNVGHLLGAINIDNFIPIKEFLERIGKLIDIVKNSKKIQGMKEIFVPGEIEYRTSLDRSKGGIPMPKTVFDRLNDLVSPSVMVETPRLQAKQSRTQCEESENETH
jgi:LDH2 family malate/lactate/ureidoglycolate dehydrogenase